MKKSIICTAIATVALLTACDNTPRYTIEGNVANADSTVLYLENVTNTMPIIVDSIMLDADGDYKFTHEVPNQAQFYRLRLAGNSINLVIDTVTYITCNADARNFATGYTIEGNDDCAIMREVTLAGSRLKTTVNNVTNDDASRNAALDSIKAYKQRMTQLILQAPSSPIAYYIIMQRINGLPIFDTFEREDNAIISAAATAHEVYYPDAPRTKKLCDIALQGIAERRRATQTQQPLVDIDSTTINEVNYIDIALYNIKGDKVTLSDVAAAHRVVLLDFTAYTLEHSPGYNMQLNEIYNQYHNSGLEIYQVSLDSDTHQWQVTANNLPWVCVNDADNVYSSLVPLYDLHTLPTCYIIVNNGAQLLRPTNVDDLKQKLAAIIG